jgi:hypothetical protein
MNCFDAYVLPVMQKAGKFIERHYSNAKINSIEYRQNLSKDQGFN